MTIEQDERKWTVKLTFDNQQCPHLFYPNVMHACQVRDKRGDADIRCRMELCPFLEKPSSATEPANAKLTDGESASRSGPAPG